MTEANDCRAAAITRLEQAASASDPALVSAATSNLELGYRLESIESRLAAHTLAQDARLEQIARTLQQIAESLRWGLNR